MFNFWWSAEWSEWQKSNEMCKKASKSSKKEMLIFGLCSTFDDWPSNLSNESWPKCKKGPLSHQKMKYLFLHYIQLLNIGWAIQATKVDQNVQKGPLSHWKMKCWFLDYVQLLMISWVMKVDQNAKRPPKSLKNEILIFALHSTSDDQLSDLSDKSQMKCIKRPLSHQKKKCSFLDYVQLLMIGQVIWAMKVDQNAKKKGPLSHQKMKCSFLDYVQLLMIGQVIWAMKVDQNAKKKAP